MRIVLSLLLVAVLSVSAMGQGKWFIASGVGLNTSRFEWYVPQSDPTIMMDIQAWHMLNKHWQLGMAVEFGKHHSFASYVNEIYDSQGNYVATQTYNGNAHILSPYFAPTVFAHYQLNFARSSYVYVGPAMGVINGQAESYIGAYITSYLAGIDWGVVIPFSKHLQLSFNNNWRITNVNLKDATTQVRQTGFFDPQNAGYSVSYYKDQTLYFFNLKLGLIVAL